ncbi:MAG: hypothetical protein IPM24_04590 [Bryobacterales bacterium]|nr:hypothetical protein [Bryobacterales bacterium]
MLNRRSFLMTAAAAATLRAQAPPKRIAAIMTVYRPNSHSDVIVGKYLEGYNQNDQAPYPKSKIVSMYTAQIPETDMSRERARRYGVPIFETVAEALTVGGDSLAVDGVLLIGEHGDYPNNHKEQKLYPRFELFLEITDEFRRSGRAVPVFNDKHLSYSWRKARRMVEISRELRFPMLAGSSVSVSLRKPAIDTPHGAPVRKAVAISYSGLDIYGFHLLESLQCMVERRAGGETGVTAVQCLEKQAVWDYLDKTPWAKRLFDRAISLSETRKPGDLRQIVPTPYVFLVDYKDGLQAAAFLLTGAVQDFTVALDIEGQSEPLSTLMWLQPGRPHHHFGCLVKNIEQMFQTGVPPYPVERTQLTSGVLDFALESRYQGHRRLETPQLAVRYQAGKHSTFCQAGPPFTTA